MSHFVIIPRGEGTVGEGMPLALDAGVVRVEGLSKADHVQARLTGQPD